MTKMAGQVYRFDKKTGEGSIVGRNDQQYRFSIKDYRGATELEEGNIVEFRADGQQAKEIRLST